MSRFIRLKITFQVGRKTDFMDGTSKCITGNPIRNSFKLKYITDNYIPKLLITCTCNVDPLKPNFYIVKLWYTRV